MADITEDNLGIDPVSVERLCRTAHARPAPSAFRRASGQIWRASTRLADDHGLRVVEDACHAFGTLVDGRAIGSCGDLTCFSFDPVKIVTSFDGGCVVVPDEAGEEQLRLYRFLGVDKETHLRYKNARAWEYDVVSDGFRYHLNSVSAAVGLSQMARIPSSSRAGRRSVRPTALLSQASRGASRWRSRSTT